MIQSGLIPSFVRHERYFPRKYAFNYRFFLAILDLDELEKLDQSTWCFSYNRFNLFSFYDKDHLYHHGKSIKDNVLNYLEAQGVNEKILSIKILTNLRILGYVFNPVSFYFIQGEKSPYILIQIGNTFSELKPYLVDESHRQGETWIYETVKEFYISLFISLTNKMTFKITEKKGRYVVLIDDHTDQGELELKASLKGDKTPWSSLTLVKYFFKFPLLSFRIITAIHYHALRLYLMKIPFIKKADNAQLQTGVYQWKQGYYQKKNS